MSKSLMHNVRFTPAELAALRSVADERSCSVVAVVRWAVRQMLAEEIERAKQAQESVAQEA